MFGIFRYFSKLYTKVKLLAVLFQSAYLNAVAISGQKGSLAEHVAGSRSTGVDCREAVQVEVERPKALVGRRRNCVRLRR